MTSLNNDEWATIIGSIADCRESLRNQDPEAWPDSFGGLAAMPRSITDIESRLGYELDADYREFLLHVDGWPNFFSDISLLSLDQLGRGPAWERAGQLLTAYYEYPVPGDSPLIGELFPIGVSAFQNDILAIIRTGKLTGIGRPVVWLANEEIERFVNMKEMMIFFLEQLKSSLGNAQSVQE